jgi:hypothetical protein
MKTLDVPDLYDIAHSAPHILSSHKLISLSLSLCPLTLGRCPWI